MIPQVCPSCGESVPAGTARCVGCKRVFGADNLCQSCRAFAPVVAANPGASVVDAVWLCQACGKERSRGPLTVVSDAGGPLTRAERPVLLHSAASFGYRAGGIGSFAAAVLGSGALATFVDGTPGKLFAAAFAAVAAGIGFVFFQRGARHRQRADAFRDVQRDGAILQLAEKSSGVLTAGRVAASLNISVDEAERLLAGLIGRDMARVELTDGGVVQYVFNAAASAGTLRVRAPVSDAESAGRVDDLEDVAHERDEDSEQRRARKQT